MRLSTLGFLLASLVYTSGTFAGEEVYKWVDSKGLTHYGAQPPKNVKATKIRTRTGHSEPSNYRRSATKTEVADATPSAPQAETPAVFKDPERCASARKSLDTLKTHARVRTQGENGEIRILTPEEHGQKMSEATKAIKESC